MCVFCLDDGFELVVRASIEVDLRAGGNMNQGPPDPHVPESQPTRQGRRLIRMLFRSRAENANGGLNEHDNRAEDAAFWKQPTNFQVTSGAVPGTTSKFASLKRKLFPSQNRRHPRQVPRLISPISAQVSNSLEENRTCVSCWPTSGDDDDGREQNQNNSEPRSRDGVELKLSKSDSQDSPESEFYAKHDSNWRATGGRTLYDDDDDRDLESAVEALDLEGSTADNTLEEMSKAIEDLRAWKKIHEQVTQEAWSKLQAEQELQPEPSRDRATNDDTFKAQFALKIQQQQRDREAQVDELRKEADMYQRECGWVKTKLDESEATRVEQALHNGGDSEGVALSRLRTELFHLDVKQRQDALLYELQGAHIELDMNIADVQAFTGELDAILAQFDGGTG